MAKHKNITTDSLEDKISKLSNILHDIKALGVNITITQRQEVRLVVKVQQKQRQKHFNRQIPAAARLIQCVWSVLISVSVLDIIQYFHC